ncbi:hypothetical protein ACFLTZ_02890 [Chloroflexota bacterium]
MATGKSKKRIHNPVTGKYYEVRQEQAKRLKELEQENSRLKRVVADLARA